MNDVTELANMGTAGVMLALIILTGFSLRLLYKFVTNHMNHSNEVFERTIKAMERMEASNQKLSEVVTRLRDVMVKETRA